jgi:glycosyltransferase involved in cell wall biosynthesis
VSRERDRVAAIALDRPEAVWPLTVELREALERDDRIAVAEASAELAGCRLEGDTGLWLFAGARALLFPIQWDEPFGLVMIEAMACGTPVIATRFGSVPEVVVDGETGLLVPPGDVAALRAALERLLGDADLRRRLGAAARERIRERFAWDAVTDATIAVYESALRRAT